MTEQAENAVIRDLAFDAQALAELDTSKIYHRLGETIDLERYLDTPRRKTGINELHDQASFAHFVNEHKVDKETHLYADRFNRRIVAIFNDATDDSSGWGDHKAGLTLRFTPEWEHWSNLDGKLVGQVQFAEHIEDGLDEIVEPEAAYVLELAQTFHATTTSDFKQAHTLESGERQFAYVENTTAGAGRQRDLTIPKEIKPGIAPYEGTQPYKITARLRYRLTEGKLTLGYKLIRPVDVLKSAFEDAVRWIAEDTSLYPHLGTPRGA